MSRRLGIIVLLLGTLVLVILAIGIKGERDATKFQESLDRNLGGTVSFSDAMDELYEERFSEVESSFSELEAKMDELDKLEISADNSFSTLFAFVELAYESDEEIGDLCSTLVILTTDFVEKSKAYRDANFESAIGEIYGGGLDEETKLEASNQVSVFYTERINDIDMVYEEVLSITEDGVATSEELSGLLEVLKRLNQ